MLRLAGRRLPIGPDSIRELVFGVEDGVVQNMTLIAGMVGGGLSGAVILFAAAVNAIAGVLSMSMGTYLSSKAEADVLAVHATEGRPDSSWELARRDATVMAAAYAAGSAIPALPFALGFIGEQVALLPAVLLPLGTLFLLGYGKALVSHQRRWRSGLEMLTLASIAGLAGFLIGAAARAIFSLDF